MRLDPDDPEQWALYTAIENAWSACMWNTQAYGHICEAKMLSDGVVPDAAKREGHRPPYRPPRRRFSLLRGK